MQPEGPRPHWGLVNAAGPVFTTLDFLLRAFDLWGLDSLVSIS